MLESSPPRLQAPRVRLLKFAVLALSATAIVLCFDANIFSFGGHGALAFAMCVVATGLAGYFTVNPTMPRWAAVVSAVALSIVAAKTTGDETDNIMMVAFLGMIAAVVLAIRPERRGIPTAPLRHGNVITPVAIVLAIASPVATRTTMADSTRPAQARPAAPAPSAKPACWAFEGAVKIAEARGATPSDCAFELRTPALRRHFCKAGSKGKSFKFVVRFEHRLGARPWPEMSETYFCAREA